ncbi:ADP-ribosylglycohydrolase family protein [Kaarinaea lacus]
MITKEERFKGCLVGLACGDAVGTTVEFQPRGSFAPVSDMLGGGPFHLKAGQWTDDTSMALCLAMSLLECDGFDAFDQMQRYCRWRAEGYMSSTGKCFDIGNTVAEALSAFIATNEPYSGSTREHSAGNGSIMRLAPVPMFYNYSLTDTVFYSEESSRTTHGARECIEACRLFGVMIHHALNDKPKETILFLQSNSEFQSKKIQAIARGDYQNKDYSDIRGSGYVIDSLEAALWCFLNTDSYQEAILKAVNLGDDADTTAAVCGQVAGAFYGIQGIPSHWRARIAMLDTVEAIAGSLLAKNI